MPTPSPQQPRAPSPPAQPIHLSDRRHIFSTTTPLHSTDIDGQLPMHRPLLRRRPRATAHKMYPVRSSPIQASQSPCSIDCKPLPPRRPQPSSSRGKGNYFAPTQGITHRAPGLNFCFQKFTNPLGIDTLHGVHVPERINCTSTPPQHNLKPAPALLDNWRLNMSKKVEIETSH